MAVDGVVSDFGLSCKDGVVSIVDKNGLCSVISCDVGGHGELDSVMWGLPELMTSEERRNEDEVEENLKNQIECRRVLFFHWTTA